MRYPESPHLEAAVQQREAVLAKNVTVGDQDVGPDSDSPVAVTLAVAVHLAGET